jgi:hypothetical protein
MDTLISVQKHLNVELIQYLSHLIAKLDISQQNEQVIRVRLRIVNNEMNLLVDNSLIF